MVFCSSCGAAGAPGAAFCAGCGSRLGSAPPAASMPPPAAAGAPPPYMGAGVPPPAATAPPPQGLPPLQGPTDVSIQCNKGQYVRTAGEEVVANSPAPYLFRLYPLINNKVAILDVARSRYIRADNGGGGKVDSAGTSVGAWEAFARVPGKLPNTVAFRSSSGHYVCAEHGGGHGLTANRSAPAEWESFTVVPYAGAPPPAMAPPPAAAQPAPAPAYQGLPPLQGPADISIQCHGKQFVRSAGTDVVASSPAPYLYRLYPVAADKVAILDVAMSRYVRAENGGGGKVSVTGTSVGEWETFSRVQGKLPNTVAFRSSTGHYVCAEHGGGHGLTANRAAPAEWESFVTAPFDASSSAPPPAQVHQGQEVNLVVHAHPVAFTSRKTAWNCDGCKASGGGKERFRCTQGCDYDLCRACVKKAEHAPPPKVLPLHPHPLGFNLKVTAWSCDACKKKNDQLRFRCTQGCDFDVCGACANRPHAPPGGAPPPAFANAGGPIPGFNVSIGGMMAGMMGGPPFGSGAPPPGAGAPGAAPPPAAYTPPPAVGGTQKCPKCNGLGSFSAFGKPCSQHDIHYRAPCQACNGSCQIPAGHTACKKCQGRGNMGAFGPCESTDVHKRGPCPVCNGACYVLPQGPACSTCKGAGGAGPFGPCEVGSTHYRGPCPACNGRCFM